MRSQVRYVPWLYRLMGHLLGLAIEVLGGVRSVGLENIPASGPGILISNHTTFADPLVAGYGTAWRVDRVVHMMSKAELRTWPVLGWLAAQGGVIFVRRGEADRDAQRNTMDILAAGGLVLLFPEGTRSPDGALIRAHHPDWNPRHRPHAQLEGTVPAPARLQPPCRPTRPSAAPPSGPHRPRRACGRDHPLHAGPG